LKVFELTLGLSLCCLVVSPVSAVQHPEIHSEHFLHGYPTGTPATNDLVIRDLYALSHNDDRKFADWVAYRLTVEEVVGFVDLGRNFRSDPWLDNDERLEPSDYTGANDAFGTERGHLAPLASFRGSRRAGEVNYLSNIVPQAGSLNRGAWGQIEDAEREIVCEGRVLWVLTGPSYLGVPHDPLPGANEPHEVPTGFWKILALPDDDSGLILAAFLFDQDTPSGDDPEDHLVSVATVQSMTGLDFFRELPSSEETALEDAVFTAGEWSDLVPSGACDRARGPP
jgi:endonuclease G